MKEGHTKFSCDRHFGLAKLNYNKIKKIETFDEAI
jgi:hypothetical protein